MAKYEIMFIIDPKEDFQIIETLVNSIFQNPRIKRLERTELAYEINKSKTGHYALVDVEATGDEIDELTSKVSISKKIWRLLVINLDKEIGREKSIKLIAQRKEKLQKDYEERQRQRETRFRDREGNDRPDRPYRRYDRGGRQTPFKEGK